MIVIDAGAVVFMVADAGPVGEAVRRRVEKERLAAPYLLDVEVSSALLGRHRGGKLTTVQLDLAWGDFARLPIRRAAHLPLHSRVRQLSDNLSAYAATYVALAERLHIPLVTGDARIARSGRASCPVEVFG